MFRGDDPAAPHRVGMDVIDFLKHRLVRIDGLWMKAFLPHLGNAVVFVRGAMGDEAVYQPAAPFCLKLRQQAVGSELLEVGYDTGECVRVKHGMEMIIHDDPGVDADAFLPLTVIQRLHENVAARWRSENGQPFHDGGGDEVRLSALAHIVAATHRRRLPQVGLRYQARIAVSFAEGLRAFSLADHAPFR